MIVAAARERTRFFRFLAVGTIGAVVDFGIFNLLSAGFGVTAVIASVFSFIAAVMSNFLWNRYWTYPDSRTKPVPQQLAQFGAVSVIGLLIRTPLFAWLEPTLIRTFQGWHIGLPLSPVTIGHNVGLAIAIGVVMLWNFFANRLWTYSDIQ